MKDKLRSITTSIRDASDRATQAINTAIEHENTKAAVLWIKQAATEAAEEAVDLGRRAARSEVVKDAAKGAAVGAAVAIPVPLIGPAVGAVVGAGAGVFINLTGSKSSLPEQGTTASQPSADFHQQMIDLDDLRQKGLLSQEEFDTEKKKLIRKR